MNLTYSIEIEDSVIIYRLDGKITSEVDYDELEKEVFENLNKNHCQIVFDLKNLTHTNSSGISFFMRTLTKSRILGGELILINVTGNVEKIFEISKLDEIYTICDDQTDAVNQFKL